MHNRCMLKIIGMSLFTKIELSLTNCFTKLTDTPKAVPSKIYFNHTSNLAFFGVNETISNMKKYKCKLQNSSIQS